MAVLISVDPISAIQSLDNSKPKSLTLSVSYQQLIDCSYCKGYVHFLNTVQLFYQYVIVKADYI